MFRSSFPHEPIHPHPREGGSSDTLSGTSHTPGTMGGTSPVSITPAMRGFATHPAGWKPHALPPPVFSHDDYHAVRFQGVKEICYLLGAHDPDWVKKSDAHVVYKYDPGSKGYTSTKFMARFGADGWKLNNPPLASQVLENALSEATPRSTKATLALDGYPAVHTFIDKVYTPQVMGGEQAVETRRQYVIQQVGLYFTDLGYEVSQKQGGPKAWYLDVCNARRDHFRVYVKQTTRGEVMPPQHPPMGSPYLIAAVRIDPVTESLKTLHLIPIAHEQGLWR
jgi:hypothetical protein